VRLMVRRNFVAPPADQATPTSWQGQCPRWAVKRIFGRQSNDGYGEDSGPSRGDPRRRIFRPIEASKAAIYNGSFTSIPAGCFAQIPAIPRGVANGELRPRP
jgi:hypothetical protein